MTQVENWDKVFDTLGELFKPQDRICKHCKYFGFYVIQVGAGCCGNKFSPRCGWWGTEESTCPMFEKLT